MKKRNLLLLVCILLIAVMAFVSCGEEPHQHSFDTSKYVSDATGHWYAATCEHTDEKVNVAAHTDANKDGVCDVCAYVSCTHTYDEQTWASDATNHWHAASCGCSVTKDSAAHTDTDKNGLCDVCQYVVCAHTKAETWSQSETKHWHAVTCGCEVKLDEADHVDANKDGNCDTCQYVVCAHTFATEWSTDAQNHWHVATCGCEVTSQLGAHVDAERDGVCDTCAYALCAAHTYADEWSMDGTQHWHAATCGCALKSALGDHVDSNNDKLCDTCGYDYDHEHSFAEAPNWSYTDSSKTGTHYLAATCGCSVVSAEAAHVDEDNDGACDVCSARWCNHTYDESVWEMDFMEKYENGEFVEYGFHWHPANCGCDVEGTEKAMHTDSNKDGVCDVCQKSQEDHVHTYGESWHYNGTQHYKQSNCIHVVFAEFGDHVDEGEDNVCDTCGAFMGELADLIDATTSAEAAAKINGVSYEMAMGVEDPYISTGSIVFANGYTIVLGDDYNTYYSTYTVGEDEKLFAVKAYFEYDNGNKIIASTERDLFATDLNALKGTTFSLLYTYEGLGTENFVNTLYSFAVDNTVYAYTERYDAATGTYGFSYVVENVIAQVIDVEVTVVEGAITKVVANAFEYAEGTFVLDTENDVFTVLPEAVAESQHVLTIDQTVGERSTDPNPYTAADYLIEDLKLYVGVQNGTELNEWDEEVPVYVASDNEIVNGSTITIKPGKDNALVAVVAEGDVAKIPFNNIEVNSGDDSYKFIADSYYPYDFYTYNKVGTWEVTVTGEFNTITFTVVVEYDNPTELSPAVGVDNYDTLTKEPAESVTVYAGNTVALGAIAAATSQNPAVVGSVDAQYAEVVTLTTEGDYVLFTATQPGEYVVTLTSAVEDTVSTTITVVVEEAPSVADLLNGKYTFTDYNSVNGTVTFTPDSEGATTGTVVIEFSLEDYWSSLEMTETATYAVEGTTVTLTHVEGDGVELFEIVINSDYTLSLKFATNPDYPDFKSEIELIKSNEGGEGGETPEDSAGTADAPIIITEGGEFTTTVEDSGFTYYIYEATADCTFTIDGDLYMQWGTDGFNFCSPCFTFPASQTLTAGQTLYLKVSSASGFAGEVAFTVAITTDSEGGETPNPEDPEQPAEGTIENPLELDELGTLDVNGEMYYTYVVTEDGTITITPDTAFPMIGYSLNGFTPPYILVETATNVAVTAGQTLYLRVDGAGYSVTLSFEAGTTGGEGGGDEEGGETTGAGTESDPYELNNTSGNAEYELSKGDSAYILFTTTEAGTLTITHTGSYYAETQHSLSAFPSPSGFGATRSPYTVEVQAGDTVYVLVKYLSYASANTCTVTVSFTASGSEGGDEPEPSAPGASAENPHEVSDLTEDVTLDVPADGEYVYIKYTAAANGKLTITFAGETSSFLYADANGFSTSNAALAPYQWEVEEGEIIYLVAKNNDGTTVTFSFEADEVGGGEEPEEPEQPDGSESNPFIVDDLSNPVTITPTSGGNTYIKVVLTEDGTLTITATDYTKWFYPALDAFSTLSWATGTYSTELAANTTLYVISSYEITFSFEAGEISGGEGGEEPEVPSASANVTGSGTEADPYVVGDLTENATMPYTAGTWLYFQYKATANGTVKVSTTMYATLYYDFEAFGYTNYAFGSAEIAIEAGQTVCVIANAYYDDTVTVSFEAGTTGGEGGETPDPEQPVEPEVGTADKPYEITDLTENVVISTPAGEDFYIQYTATADGLVKFQTTSYYANFYYSVVEFSKDTSSFSAPSIVVRAGQTLYMIVNDYYGYDLTVSFSEGIPAGLKENPHDLGDLVEDETVVKSSSNYYFVFTAPANGKLTITSDYSYMNLDYDFESINNLSTLGAQPPVEVEMTKGQTIYVLANGYDNTKTVTFSFEAEPDEPASVPVEGGSASEPTTITESATYTVVVAAGEKAYFSIPNTAIGSDAVYATITVEGATLYVNEVACADGSFSGVIDLTAVSKLVAIENNGEESATITFVVTLDVAEDSGDDPF